MNFNVLGSPEKSSLSMGPKVSLFFLYFPYRVHIATNSRNLLCKSKQQTRPTIPSKNLCNFISVVVELCFFLCFRSRVISSDDAEPNPGRVLEASISTNRLSLFIELWPHFFPRKCWWNNIRNSTLPQKRAHRRKELRSGLSAPQARTQVAWLASILAKWISKVSWMNFKI